MTWGLSLNGGVSWAVCTKPGQLSHFAICRKDGFITCDTVLLDGEIYECNFDKTPACYRSDLEDRWKKVRSLGKHAVVSGPA